MAGLRLEEHGLLQRPHRTGGVTLVEQSVAEQHVRRRVHRVRVDDRLALLRRTVVPPEVELGLSPFERGAEPGNGTGGRCTRWLGRT